MGGRFQNQLVFGILLLGWAALCFWAGLSFGLVASLLLLAGLIPVALFAGHRFVSRWYVMAEIVALIAGAAAWALTGLAAAGVTFAGMLGVDTLVLSALVLAKGRGAFRNATRNLLIILATLGVATGASATTAVLVPVPSCGTASVGAEGATTPGSAEAGQCFVTSAESCLPRTLTVSETTLDEIATHHYRVVADSNAHCHFIDAVTYGPQSHPGEQATSYTCPALTDQIGAPGEQQVQLTQCSSAIAAGIAAPIIPTNAYQPLPSATPPSG